MESNCKPVNIRPLDVAVWNKHDLPPPPVCTVESKWTREIRIMNGAIKKLLTSLEPQNILSQEKELLTAITLHYKSELRRDKPLQSVNKVLHCLKKFQSLNLESIATEFEKTSLQCQAFDYQPSRQMLEFILVRVYGLIVLTDATIHTCFHGANRLKGMMEVGHLPAVALIMFSSISRIWKVSKQLVENAVEWYLLLRPLLKFLKPTKAPWLPAGVELPDTPYEAINAPWLDRDKISASIGSFLSVYEEPAVPRTNLECLTSSHDLGETISRQSVAAYLRPVTGIGGRPDLASDSAVTATKPGLDQQAKFVPPAEPAKHFFKRKLSRPSSTQSSDHFDVEIENKKRKLSKDLLPAKNSKPTCDGSNIDSARSALSEATQPNELWISELSGTLVGQEKIPRRISKNKELKKLKREKKLALRKEADGQSGFNGAVQPLPPVQPNRVQQVDKQTEIPVVQEEVQKRKSKNKELKKLRRQTKLALLKKVDGENNQSAMLGFEEQRTALQNNNISLQKTSAKYPSTTIAQGTREDKKNDKQTLKIVSKEKPSGLLKKNIAPALVKKGLSEGVGKSGKMLSLDRQNTTKKTRLENKKEKKRLLKRKGMSWAVV